MKIKWLCFVLVATMLLTGCANTTPEQSTAINAQPQADYYSVCLASDLEATNLFTTDVETFSLMEADMSTSFDPPGRISLQVGSTIVELNYYSTGINTHQYRSEDESVRCQLNAETGSLSFLTVTDFTLLPEFICKDAVSFEASVKQIISAYYNEDWSKYTVTCQTTKILHTDNSVEPQIFDGFLLAENTNEEISRYRLEFNRIIDGVKVADNIEVSLSPHALMISFSSHKFDEVEEIEVNAALVNASVDNFLNTYIDDSQYALKEYTLLNPVVTRVDNRLYYAASAEMILEIQTDTGEKVDITSIVSLFTDIEVDVTTAKEGNPVRPYRIVTSPAVIPTEPVQTDPELPAEYLYAQNENYEAFIFDGLQPEFAVQNPIDISGLTNGRLYLYNKSEDRCIEVTEQPVNKGTAFLLTDERIYFVLEEDPKSIRQANLDGQELEPFCTGFTGESIVYLCYYGTNATDGLMIFNDNYKRYMGYQANKGFGKKFSAETLGYTWLGDLYLVYHEEHNAALVHFEQNSETVAQTGTVVFWD